jgi:hypothetical protein
MATVLLAHFSTSLQKDTEVPYFRTSVLFMKFFSPPPVFNVTNFVEIFFLIKKMISYSCHCEGALFSQDLSLDSRYFRFSVNFHTMIISLFWHVDIWKLFVIQ